MFTPPGPQMADGPVGPNAHLGWQMPQQPMNQGQYQFQPQMQQPQQHLMGHPDIRALLLQRMMMQFQGGQHPQQAPMLNPQAIAMFQQMQQNHRPFFGQMGMQQQGQQPSHNPQFRPMQQDQMGQMGQQMGGMMGQMQPQHMNPQQIQALVAQIAQGKGA